MTTDSDGPEGVVSDRETFWQIRSADYDKLYWVKHDGYLNRIVELADLGPNHVVLDVGTGTGVIARSIQPHVGHVVAIDISNAMLSRGSWEGFSTIRLDIGESFFADATFDRIFARMVFHHVLDNLDRALTRCYDVLKHGGKIILAEGVPPSDEPEVVDWYTEMFRHKEERITFVPDDLRKALHRNGFANVGCEEYFMDSFSIKNWLENSGLDIREQKIIMDLHRNADARTKELYRMQLTDDDCLIRTKNVILVGER